MEVSSVTIRYTRKVQAQQFEPVEAETAFTANLHPGDNVEIESEKLMLLARKVVHDGLRGGGTGGATLTAPVALATGTAASKADPAPAAQADAPAAHRGRKTAAEKAAEAAAAGAPAAGDATGDQIRTNPEDRRDPAAAAGAVSDIPDDTKAGKGTPTPPATVKASDIPDDAKAASAATAPTVTATAAVAPTVVAGSLTNDTLQTYITKQVQGKKIPVARVKEIMAEHSVARTSDIPVDQLAVVKQKIDDAIELAKING